MKFLFLILVFLISLKTFAQGDHSPLKVTEDGSLALKKSFQTVGLTKADLNKNAQLWNFNLAKITWNMFNAEEESKIFMPIQSSYLGYRLEILSGWRFLLSFKLSDNNYEYEINSFEYFEQSSKSWIKDKQFLASAANIGKEQQQQILAQLQKTISDISSTLQTQMVKKRFSLEP